MDTIDISEGWVLRTAPTAKIDPGMMVADQSLRENCRKISNSRERGARVMLATVMKSMNLEAFHWCLSWYWIYGSCTAVANIKL